MSKSLLEHNTYICDVCAKPHYRNQRSIFKLIYKGHVKHFCGYNCYIQIKQLIDHNDYDIVDDIFKQADIKIAEMSQQPLEESIE